MVDGLKYGDLPVCKDRYEGFRYRAIKPFSVITEGAIPESDIEPPDDFSMEQFKTFYGLASACRLPDTKNPNAYKFFLTFPYEFGIGGQDHPYPDSVPTCNESDTLFRAAAAMSLKPGASELPGLLVLHENALISPQWVPITDENLGGIERSLSRSKSTYSMCQKRISDDPERHGLFFARKARKDNADPFSKMSDKVVGNDIHSQIVSYEETVAAVPGKLRACATPMADFIDMAVWKESIRDMRARADEMSGDPYIGDVLAPEVTLDVMERVGFVDIGDSEVATLQNIISFALEGGLAGSDIESVAVELAKGCSDPENVIYGLYTVASLRIARALHNLHAGNGGISTDFGEFATSIEKAVIDGRVGIRTRSMRDHMRAPNATAFYDPAVNDIFFPSLDSGVSPYAYFRTIIHESYHAFQDMKGVPMSKLDLEWEAHTYSTRASILLNEVTGRDDNPLMKTVKSESSEYADAKFELGLSAGECDGMPLVLIDCARDERIKKDEAYRNWEDAVRSNLLRGTNHDERDLFIEYYRLANADSLFSKYDVRAILSRGYEYDACVKTKGADSCNSDFLDKAVLYNFDYEVFAETPDGARDALTYLQKATDVSALLYYADREIWSDMLITDICDVDSLMDALLQLERKWDGI